MGRRKVSLHCPSEFVVVPVNGAALANDGSKPAASSSMDFDGLTAPLALRTLISTSTERSVTIGPTRVSVTLPWLTNSCGPIVTVAGTGNLVVRRGASVASSCTLPLDHCASRWLLDDAERKSLLLDRWPTPRMPRNSPKLDVEKLSRVTLNDMPVSSSIAPTFMSIDSATCFHSCTVGVTKFSTDRSLVISWVW